MGSVQANLAHPDSGPQAPDALKGTRIAGIVSLVPEDREFPASSEVGIRGVRQVGEERCRERGGERDACPGRKGEVGLEKLRAAERVPYATCSALRST